MANVTNKHRPKNAGMLRSYLVFQSFIFKARSALALKQSQVQHLWVRIPLCLHEEPSAFQQRSCSLSPYQVSFCWKSLGCWKRRRWQRKRRALTVASLMWCLAQPTCSGECRGGVLFPFFSNGMIPTAAPGGTEHMSYFVAKMDEPEFSIAEQKGGNIKQREFFSQRFIFLLI